MAMSSICTEPNTGAGYYANCTYDPRWGAGVKFLSQAACYNACAASGDAGCGNCSYISPAPAPVIREPLIEPGMTLFDDKKGIDLKLIIIAVIAFLILSRS